MDPSAALLAGLIAGLAIAMQVGAVSLLLVEAAVVAGPRAGVAAGMGVATADFGFAAVAAAAGGAAGAALASHETEIRIVGGARPGRDRGARPGGGGARVRERGAGSGRGWRPPARALRPLPRDHGGEPADDRVVRRRRGRAVARRPEAAAAFAVGVGAASAGWHLVLTLAAGHAGRWITPGIRRGLAIGGRLVVLAIAAHLAFG